MARLILRALPEKANFVRDHNFYVAWALGHRKKCEACWVPERKSKWPGMSTHHIIKPGRSDEACNLLRLCAVCHDLAEGRAIRVNGELLPKLTIGICLSLKMESAPGEFDFLRLGVLFGRPLPDREAVPRYLMEERKKWAG